MATDELKLTTEDAELEETATPFSALYAHWERSQWSPLDIDFTTDAETFAAMSESDRHGFVWMFANRFHAEFNVARLLAPFLLAAPDWEMQLLLATQVADEHRHMQCVLRVYEDVFGVRGGIEAIRKLADEGLDPVSKTLLYDTLEEWTLPLLERQDEDTFLQAVVAYHLIGEGVVARTGQYLAARQYDRYHGFPGLVEGQRRVSRDEARHIGIGVSYVRRRMETDREHTSELIGSMAMQLYALAGEMLDTANSQMSDLVGSGYGVTPQEFYEVAMQLTQRRLKSIGLDL
ncbi:MAG TPA: ribonucleotide-diphosphate reductase subunit beta [Gaiellaceae bacterium]|nr:ribonucleotide-diphosphate reductase subunit beta [Gaiellaceae bacterium]